MIVKTARHAQILFCHGREWTLEGRKRPCLLGVVPFGRCRNSLRSRVGFGSDFGNPRGFRQRERGFRQDSAGFCTGPGRGRRVLGEPSRRPIADVTTETGRQYRRGARTPQRVDGGRRGRPPDRSMQPRAIGAHLASSARTRASPATLDAQRAATHPTRRGGAPRRPRLVDLRRGTRRPPSFPVSASAGTCASCARTSSAGSPTSAVSARSCARTHRPGRRSAGAQRLRERDSPFVSGAPTSRRGGGGCAPVLRRARRAHWCA